MVAVGVSILYLSLLTRPIMPVMALNPPVTKEIRLLSVPSVLPLY
jgi:hypothetical protein